MNEYCGDRNVYRKLSTVDGNDNFRRLPSPLINGKIKFDKPEIHICNNLTVSTD